MATGTVLFFGALLALPILACTLGVAFFLACVGLFFGGLYHLYKRLPYYYMAAKVHTSPPVVRNVALGGHGSVLSWRLRHQVSGSGAHRQCDGVQFNWLLLIRVLIWLAVALQAAWKARQAKRAAERKSREAKDKMHVGV
jgi:hypothetical protein